MKWTCCLATCASNSAFWVSFIPPSLQSVQSLHLNFSEYLHRIIHEFMGVPTQHAPHRSPKLPQLGKMWYTSKWCNFRTKRRANAPARARFV